MYALLPKLNESTADSVLQKLDKNTLDIEISKMANTTIDLGFPKFKLKASYNDDLKKVCYFIFNL